MTEAKQPKTRTNLTDRELLDLAAKAAGHTVEAYNEARGHLIKVRDGVSAWWNPLRDDGNALRLAVKLRIEFYEGAGDGPEAWAGYYKPGFVKQKFACEPFGKDPYAATRRAIVRAAAEIGRARA